MPATATAARRRLLVFTKPATEGRVKTRLIGDLTPRQATDLHAAFLDDLLARLRPGHFDLRLAWALDPHEPIPSGPFPGLRQSGGDLGERLYQALTAAAAEAPAVAALGSDHPTLPLAIVHRAFEAVESGVPVVLGPADDGGYYLIALAAGAVAPRLFAGIPWSTERVLGETLARCDELGLACELLPGASDVDTPRDLERLASRMAADDLGCPRTRELLAGWRLVPPLAASAIDAGSRSGGSRESAGSSGAAAMAPGRLAT
jgi:rSAM/selenodomain-associated transferase 1